MSIDILTIGKIKNPHAEGYVRDLEKRINRLHPCRLRQLKPSRYTDEIKDGRQIMEEEGDSFLSAMNRLTRCILLDRTGRQLDSLQFSRLLNEAVIAPGAEAAMVVGGFLGACERVKARAGHVIALSPLTFSHEVALMVLMEQIFRALTIIKNIPYHK